MPLLIETFRVRGYKALADVQLSLTPLHVVIGPNDSGKTSIQEALAALCRSTVEPLSECFAGDWTVDAIAANGDLDSRIEFTAGGRDGVGELGYDLTLGFGDGRQELKAESESFRTSPGTKFRTKESYVDKGRTAVQSEAAWNALFRETVAKAAVVQSLRHRLRNWLRPPQLCRWVPSTLALPNAPDASRRFRLDPDGFGLTLMLDDLLGESREAFAELEADFRGFFPDVKGLKLRSAPAWSRPTGSNAGAQVQKDGKALSFSLDNGHDLPAAQASDGLLLVLAYLTLLHLPEPPGLLLVEEPENGIHPKRLESVIETLRKLTERGGTQVLATTHSPHVLDCFQPEEVTICARRRDRTVATRKLSDSEKVQKEKSIFTLGEIWAASNDAAMAGVDEGAESAENAGA